MRAQGYALDVDQLVPLGPLQATSLVTVAVVALVVMAVLIVVVVRLWRPRRVRKAVPSGAHATGSQHEWLRRIDAVTKRYEQGELSRDEAFVKLSEIARAYASAASGRPVSSQTLADLTAAKYADDSTNWELLRQTIAGIYPPEFASASDDVSVEDAAAWVARLVERWR
ncbi:hypothetical protein [Bifidobacterium gallicum]|uniref:Uncharacterized protein n=1 Tax=Bifidobacterium gallicum DSM 20093 = LMG 11596 TaxID=561180 RepID=D1NU79_9BIFI|nr:hypothetical protein [Bifidobacterium gallicum]EFA23283.1 hypothetical protein BIFGAL_03400 [Bifidobacterium gallicum DSM 20093 = LMG 11596]KFI58927.1 hypothetical protein BGLCM_1224 [Bifidobacterium gallicum DSM 20093 = LMG 11596]